MIELDIVERLRGKVRVPVNDGAGLLDGKDFFERTFPTSKAAMEAADEIERLRSEIRDAFYAGFFAFYGPADVSGVDQAIKDEEQAWKDYAERENLAVPQEIVAK